MSEISLMYFYYINLLILQLDLYLQKYFEILAYHVKIIILSAPTACSVTHTKQ